MVHYQSRAQVPASCVGKPRRPPVLQVSTIQTPGRGEDSGEGPGGAPDRAKRAARLISRFLLCGESSQTGAQTQVLGGWGGEGRESSWGRGLRGVIYGLHLVERGAGKALSPCLTQFQG